MKRLADLDTAHAAGVITLGALCVLIALRTGFGGVLVKIGD